MGKAVFNYLVNEGISDSNTPVINMLHASGLLVQGYHRIGRNRRLYKGEVYTLHTCDSRLIKTVEKKGPALTDD